MLLLIAIAVLDRYSIPAGEQSLDSSLSNVPFDGDTLASVAEPGKYFACSVFETAGFVRGRHMSSGRATCEQHANKRINRYTLIRCHYAVLIPR